MARILCIVALGGLGSVISGCGLGAADDHAPLTVFDNFRVIKDGQAYRSAQLDASSLRLVIEEYGIRTIINLRGENGRCAWYRAERAVADDAGVELIDVRMSANNLPSRETLLLLYDTYMTAEYPILLHCQSGADRTGAAAAIWRMVVNGEPRAAAGRELSVLAGHFSPRYPMMDYLVAVFEPDRSWIESKYPPQQ